MERACPDKSVFIGFCLQDEDERCGYWAEIN